MSTDELPLTFSAGELPASPSPSLASVVASKMPAATSASPSVKSPSPRDPDLFSGKTSPASCPVAGARTLDASLLDCLERMLPFGLRSEDGTARALSLDPSMAWPGAYSTPNISECPNADVASSLSDILETGDVPRGYYLSPKACRGILRRAGKRGKDLPPQLQTALEQVCSPCAKDAMGGGPVIFQQNSRSEVRNMGDKSGAVTGQPSAQCQNYVAFTQNQDGDILSGGVCPSMGTNQNATGRNTPKVQAGMSVRRLTPVECERLQGFEDDHTKVPVYLVRHRKSCPTMQPRLEPFNSDPEQEEMAREVEKVEIEMRRVEVIFPTEEKRAPCGCKVRHMPASECPDGPRYKAIGNSMAVPAIRWIGERIRMVDNLA